MRPLLRPIPRLPLLHHHHRRRITTLPLTNTLPPTTSTSGGCACRPTPTLSSPIDHDTPLRNSAPRYTQHLLLPSAVRPEAWASKIEGTGATAAAGAATSGTGGADGTLGHAAATLKAALRGVVDEVGLVTAVYPPPGGGGAVGVERSGSKTAQEEKEEEVWILPRGDRFVDWKAAKEWAEASATSSTSTSTPASSPASPLPPSISAVILVCVHGTRDTRCGEMGPVVLQQFADVLRARPELQGKVVVAGCSHLSGHKWAGNVVVYRRHQETQPEGERGGNAFWGVWYGRVTPREVEAIVAETVEKGRVLDAGLLRGVVGAEVEVDAWTGGGGAGLKPRRRGREEEKKDGGDDDDGGVVRAVL